MSVICRTAIGLAVILLLSGTVAAVPPDLSQLIGEAWANHPDIVAMQRMADAETSRTAMAGGWMNPQFRVGVMNLPQTFNFRQDPMTMIQVGVMQRIPYPGKTAAGSKVSALKAAAANTEVQTGKNAMAGMIAMAYYDLAGLIAVKATLAEGCRIGREMTETATLMVASGMGAQSDVYRSRMSEETWNAQMIENDRAIKGKLALLAYAVGSEKTSAGISPSLPDGLPILPPLDSLLSNSIIDNTPEVVAAMTRLEAARADIDRANLSYYPDFDVMAAYGYRMDLNPTGVDHFGNPITEVMKQDNMVSFEISVPVPLFYKENQRADVMEMTAMSHSASAQVENIRIAKQRDIKVLYEQYQDRLERYALTMNRILPAAELTYEAALVDYRAGRSPFMNLSQAQMDKVMTQMTAVMLKAEAWGFQTEIKAALGIRL